MKKVVITSYARTAVGAFMGGLKTVPVENLATCAIKGAMERSNIEADQVDEVILGHVISTTDSPQLARDAALLLGMEQAPGFTVNRICGSGLQAIASGWQEIVTGSADIVIAGGAESLSRAPYYLPLESRFQPMGVGSKQLKCANEQSHFNAAPNACYDPVWMGNTAEKVASQYEISRQDQDQFAYDSQMKAKAAQEKGRFAKEIIPYEIKSRKKTTIIDTDEHPRFDITLDSLASLKPAFQKDGNVTPGNATGMNDGAAALVLMSEEKCKELGLEPIAYIKDWAISALDPTVMGLGPAFAIPKVLQKYDLTLDQMDLIEINEAFAAQVLGCMQEMGWDMDSPLYERLNVNGGAIALGHPLGCSGARITGSLALDIQERDAKYGVSSACIGGGMGISILLER